MRVLQVVLVIILSQSSHCARILGVIPTPSYSHQVVFQPLWKELSLRGHQVILLTTNPIKDHSLTNLIEIDLSFSYKFLEENLPEIINSSQNVLKSASLSIKSFANVVDAQLEYPPVKRLLQDPNEHFDLVIAEYFMASVLFFAKRFNCPCIGVISMDGNNFVYRQIGNFGHPIVYPDPFSRICGKSSLIDRIRLVMFELYFQCFDLNSEQQKVAKKHFGDDTSISEVLANVSLLFVNTDPIFHEARALLPMVIPIGGSIARVPVKPLEKSVKKFLDEAHQGFIYFSLGSNVKSKDIPERTMDVVLETLRELNYKVLWKYELNDLPNKPENVMISKWVTQVEVLNHPNLKLFITHGGAQSMEETIQARVPVVAMPFFADQPCNVQQMVSLGFALSVDYKTMSIGNFKKAILEVINNVKYRNRIRELADLAEDQPMTGLERAVWWTEYVIRHKGAAHLKSPALDMPWYQYYFLDVISVLLFTLIGSLYFIVKAIRATLGALSRNIARSKAKKN